MEKSGGVVVTKKGEEGELSSTNQFPVHVIPTSSCDNKNKKVTKNQRLKRNVTYFKLLYFKHFFIQFHFYIYISTNALRKKIYKILIFEIHKK